MSKSEIAALPSVVHISIVFNDLQISHASEYLRKFKNVCNCVANSMAGELICVANVRVDNLPVLVFKQSSPSHNTNGICSNWRLVSPTLVTCLPVYKNRVHHIISHRGMSRLKKKRPLLTIDRMFDKHKCDTNFIIKCNKNIWLRHVPQYATAIFRKIRYDYNTFASLR